jgi:hypothetical protein
MNLEKVIMDLTSKTPSGGTCWVGNVPFTVWYGSDYWEWEFQGAFYFDLQDLSDAIEAFQTLAAEVVSQITASADAPKPWPRLSDRRRIAFPSHRGPSGLASGATR